MESRMQILCLPNLLELFEKRRRVCSLGSQQSPLDIVATIKA
jgi:hypothetical protein